MARKKISKTFWKTLEPPFPQATVSPKGGRPRVDDHAALNGILFVLQTGIPWEDLPQELGFGSGMTCWRRLRDWQASGLWQRLHRALLTKLREHDQIDRTRASIDGASVPSPRGRTDGPEPDRPRQKGQQTAPDRGSPGCSLGLVRHRRQPA